MILKRSKLQPEDISLPSPPLSTKRSEIFPSGRFSTTVRRQPLLGIETSEEFIYSKWSREWMQTKMLFDGGSWIHRYTKRYSRKAISPFLLHPSRLSNRVESSTWKWIGWPTKTSDSKLDRELLVVALEPIAVVYISYQKQRIFPPGVNSIHRSSLRSLSSLRRRIDPPKLTLTC